MAHPNSPTVHVVDSVPNGHVWDVTPHELITIRANDVRLGDVILDGCAQVTGVAQAEHRGDSAIRLDFDDLVTDSQDAGRLVLRINQQITVKRYSLADEALDAALYATPNALRLRAFNIVQGMVILRGGIEVPVTKVSRDASTETILVYLRGVDHATLDYNDEVDVVGSSVNPDDFDDNDFGVS